METHRIPGLALAVVHGGKLIHSRGYGVTSVEEGCVPVTPKTLFRIGSTTKALTGAALMRLVEAGKLDLDRPVKEYTSSRTLGGRSSTVRWGSPIRPQIARAAVPTAFCGPAFPAPM